MECSDLESASSWSSLCSSSCSCSSSPETEPALGPVQPEPALEPAHSDPASEPAPPVPASEPAPPEPASEPARSEPTPEPAPTSPCALAPWPSPCRRRRLRRLRLGSVPANTSTAGILKRLACCSAGLICRNRASSWPWRIQNSALIGTERSSLENCCHIMSHVWSSFTIKAWSCAAAARWA